MTIEERLTMFGSTEVSRWWAALPPAARVDLERRWTPPAWRFVAFHDTPPEPSSWNQDLYEYIVAHDVPFFLGRRTFHICRAHPAARECLREGRISGDFRCPLGRARCPMRELADAVGRDVRLAYTAATSVRESSQSELPGC